MDDDTNDTIAENTNTVTESLEGSGSHESEIIKCIICDFETSDQICMADHFMIVHERLFGNSYYCHRCNIEFVHRRDLNRHLTLCGRTDKEHDSDNSDDEATNITESKDDKNDEDDEDTKDGENHIDDIASSEDSEDSNSSDDEDDKEDKKSEITEEPPQLTSINHNQQNFVRRMRRNAIPSLDTNLEIKTDLLPPPAPRRTNPRSSATIRQLGIRAGRYECNICNHRFTSQYYLGDHFISEHSSYEHQLSLDNVPKTGFPGFSILSYIKMIYVPTDRKELLEIANTKCCICYSDFSIYNYYTKYDNTRQQINAKYIDSIFDDPIKKVVFPHYIDACHQASKSYNNYKIKNKHMHYPIVLTCCNNSICHKCIRSSIMQKNDIICPLCMKNHNKIKCDYIKIIKPTLPNKKSWMSWWIRNNHLEILF